MQPVGFARRGAIPSGRTPVDRAAYLGEPGGARLLRRRTLLARAGCERLGRGLRVGDERGGQASADRAPRALEIADNGFKEWVGLVAYRLAGYTDALFPAP